jgi:hypothetical protein
MAQRRLISVLLGSSVVSARLRRSHLALFDPSRDDLFLPLLVRSTHSRLPSLVRAPFGMTREPGGRFQSYAKHVARPGDQAGSGRIARWSSHPVGVFFIQTNGWGCS